ncbi:MAG: hypothetical protein ACPGYV_04330 [Phycisphaeraceae bacterium]
MDDVQNIMRLPWLVAAADAGWRSMWGTIVCPTETRGGMLLSQRFDCGSLRLRESEPGYRTDWHLAGEAVLIVIRQGTLRIETHGDDPRDFHPGDAFVVADALPDDQPFDPTRHGHTAEVVGDQTLKAIHIKLNEFSP